MIKNKLDFKLINILIIGLIIYLIYLTSNFWLNAVGIIYKICLPFFLSFTLAYALYPILNKLKKYKIPKSISILSIYVILFSVIIILLYLIIPLIVTQIDDIFLNIITFIKQISQKCNINFLEVQTILYNYYDKFINNISKYIYNGAFDMISIFFDYISKIIIIIITSIYFLFDMDKIRKYIKKKTHKNNFIFDYLFILDKQMYKYFGSLVILMIISFIEYTFVYFLVRHPSFLLLGIIAAIGNLIPYFGGLISAFISLITSFVIGPKLFVKVLIAILICLLIDSYIINPLVYKKQNKIKPILVIISVFIFGYLFGWLGLVIALPITIIIISTYKFIKIRKKYNIF